MQKIQLSVFLSISGIGSASGIVFKDNSLYIISDNSGFLYQFNIYSSQLIKHSLLENTSENILKKLKPDFEAITQVGNELHIFGSGSTPARNKSYIFDTKTQKVTENNFTYQYENIKSQFSISSDDLNIEGALYYNQKLHLFQRGNGENSKNGIIIFNDDLQFIPIQLPKIKHVEATFTDAIRVENKFYFLASAEDTTSTYEDGEVLGSIIGCMDIETFQVDFTKQVSDYQKFEGLAVYEISEHTISFLLCEDNDTESLESVIYELIISK